MRERAPEYAGARDADAEIDAGASASGDRDADLDALEDLGDEIATLAAHIHAATHRLLELIAEFDGREGWALGGHRSCAHWLAFRTDIDLGAAREKVRTARALTKLPETSASMARGELSFSQVRALTRVVNADNEADLLELARDCTTAQLERVVRGWKRGSRQNEEELDRMRHDSRTLSIFPDHDGMYQIRGNLPPELGVLLMRAVEAASDALHGARTEAERETEKRADSGRVAARRRADALGLLAERALAAGFGGGGSGRSGSECPGSEHGASEPAPISGTRAERYQVVLHVDVETLREDGEPGRSELEDGTRISAETSRRLCCDAAVVRISYARDGSVLDVGRRTRSISPALRRALEARDRGCRFPGCGLRFTEGHHLRHWADGGETSLANAVLLCRHHHRLVHEGGWTVRWWGEGRPVFCDPRGGTHYDGRWTPPKLPADPVEALRDTHRLGGVEPDWRTAGARWKCLEDVPDGVLFRAMEALE